MDWIIDVSSILSEIGLSKHFNFVIKDLIDNIPDDICIKKDIKVEGNIINDDGKLLVTGNIRYDFKANCSRCLKEVNDTILVEFEEMFYSENNPERDEEDYYFHSNKIDLKPAIRDNVLLNLPYKVLCKEDCKGLCEKCGADLNKGSCDCESQDIDPRMAVFKDIKKEFENKNAVE